MLETTTELMVELTCLELIGMLWTVVASEFEVPGRSVINPEWI